MMIKIIFSKLNIICTTVILLFVLYKCYSPELKDENKKIKLPDTNYNSTSPKLEETRHVVVKRDSLFAEFKSKFFKAYEENYLEEKGNEVYRFVWFNPLSEGEVRSFIIRLEELNNKYLLVAKYAKKGRIVKKVMYLSKNQWLSFGGEVNAAYFWSLESNDSRNEGTRLEYWHLEGRKDSSTCNETSRSYHCVLRLNPYLSCFRNACELLVKFAEVDVINKVLESK